MARKRHIRKKRGRAWDSESSARANKARWAKDRARRDAGQHAREMEMELIDAVNLPRRKGDAVGMLQWVDFATGEARRWTVRMGDRVGRFTVHSPDGRVSRSHGWTAIFNGIRSGVVRSLGRWSES